MNEPLRKYPTSTVPVTNKYARKIALEIGLGQLRQAGAIAKCEMCKGSGDIFNSMFKTSNPCRYCDGRGEVYMCEGDLE